MPHQQSSPDSPNLPPSDGDRQGPPRRSSSHRLVMLPRTTEDNNKSDSPNGDKKKNPDIKIPKIQPVEQGEPLAELAQGLVGKFVDEFGNILDWDGTVLGSVEGDLPSMVGRPVSESGGDFGRRRRGGGICLRQSFEAEAEGSGGGLEDRW
ncbi:uncharacterized protein TrAtP1_007286 [Trichoderma atroviride]|uniref:uncharacterized protein n=1 Tax=Hypocrea atroviridis TaxID=63577 RepID=UPI003327CADC|nr:hypothetical protein TrAtP1_007286 [Trichoderma atroviride]